MIQLTAKGQEHIRKIVDHYIPIERIKLNELFSEEGIETEELTDDELYSLCNANDKTDNLWYSLATLWEV